MLTPKEYLRLRREIYDLMDSQRRQLKLLHEEAMKCPLPSKLRPAIPDDVVIGAVFWYPPDKYSKEHFWKIVDDVLHPTDPWKAYCADDGCCYGIDEAYVEEE